MLIFLLDVPSGGLVFEPERLLGVLERLLLGGLTAALVLLPPVSRSIACLCLSLYAGENSRFCIPVLADFTEPESLDFVVLRNGLLLRLTFVFLLLVPI